MGNRASDSKSQKPFADNWAYIKTELQWLDRLLLLAVGRHKRDRKETEQASRSQRDRITRHWWKGIVSLDSTPRYDDIRPAAESEAAGLGDSARVSSAGASGSGAESSGTAGGTAGAAGSVGSGGTVKPGGYQQQLEQRIRLTQAQGILLALPALRDRLNLSLFEKNLLLLGLAPEVNRRYARLYSYLQDNETTQLPQLDLALKLLCRNDQEWQAARMRLTSESPLVEAGLLSFVAPSNRPLLMHSIQLSPRLVNYALAKPVQREDLDLLLNGGTPFSELSLGQADDAELTLPDRDLKPNAVRSSLVGSVEPSTPAKNGSRGQAIQPTSQVSNQKAGLGYFSPPPDWSRYEPEANVEPAWNKFIGARSLKQELQHLAHRLQSIAFDEQPAVAAALGNTQLANGTFAIFHGPGGTGKTTAAHLIAQTAQTPLITVDLRQYPAVQLAPLLADLLRQSPTALMIDGAECLLAPTRQQGSRQPGSRQQGTRQQGSRQQDSIPADLVHRFFAQRRTQPCLTMFSVHLLPLIAVQWQQQCDRALAFSLPNAKARERLWKQAFPKGTRFEKRLDWQAVARWRLSGGQIQAIAYDAHLYARLAEQKTVTQANIERAKHQRP